MSIATGFGEGRWSMWEKDRWVFQVLFPYLGWNRHKRELRGHADTAFRVNWPEKAVGFTVLGFGLAFSTYTRGYRRLRNDGLCYHGVSLKRVCRECAEPTPEQGETT